VQDVDVGWVERSEAHPAQCRWASQRLDPPYASERTSRAGWGSPPYNEGGSQRVRHQVGFALQLVVLMFLPLVIGWQLFFGFPLIAMPACLLVGICVFSVGHVLRRK